MKRNTGLNSDKKGFTLAETLITVTILGVIAAITLSSIFRFYEKSVNVTKLKKAYSRISNAFQETLIASNCQFISCAIENNNVPYNNTSSYDVQLERLKVFFPEIKKNDDFSCIPKDIYSLNGYKYSTSSGIYKFGGQNLYSYCLKDVGLLISNSGLSQQINCYSKSSWARCYYGYIYTGKKNGKAVLGKNLFGIQNSNGGEENLQPLQDGDCITNKTDIDENFPNGAGCTKKIIQDGWKINY